MNIITNNIPRELLSWHELPTKAQADFDYVEEDERHNPYFVKFKDDYYDVYDSQSIQVCRDRTFPVGWAIYVRPEDPLAKWDAVSSESFFSGTLFRFTLDDRVVVGRYYS